jgi:hypothetical protein
MLGAAEARHHLHRLLLRAGALLLQRLRCEGAGAWGAGAVVWRGGGLGVGRAEGYVVRGELAWFDVCIGWLGSKGSGSGG